MNSLRLILTACAIGLGASGICAQSVFKSSLPVRPGKGITVAGTVECDGKPVAGVKVSDGYEITKTDRKGAYYLKSKKQNPQVFISVPAGYEAHREDVLPQYWADFTEEPDVYERHDFKLDKVDDKKHAFIAITDLHMANQRNDCNTFSGEYMDKLRNEVKELTDNGYHVFSFHLGDGSWDSYWYVNDFPISRLRDTFNNVGYPTAIYNCMGNHDNNGAQPSGNGIDTDFEAARPFMKAFGPRYFSFDAGDVHYIMLDNIIYKNEPTEKEKMPGIWGKRNFSEKITPEQFDWIKKDLADVPADRPIVIAMHCPLIQYKGASTQIEPKLNKESAATLLEILKPYKNVHTISGHTHRQALTRMTEGNALVDHNICSASGSTWWNTAFGSKNLGMDGNPGGYEVFTIDGPEIKWRHETWDFEPGRQFVAYDMNKVKEYFAGNGEYQAFRKLYPKGSSYETVPENTVYINLWAWDPAGKLKVTENGRELPVEMFLGENPNFTATAQLQRSIWINSYSKSNAKPKLFRMFKVQASAPDTPIEISWTDPFGVEFKETLKRPAPYSFENVRK